MLNEFRENVKSEKMDAHIAKFFNTKSAAARLSREVLILKSALCQVQHL